MPTNQIIKKIEALLDWEKIMEEAKAEAEALRDEIKQEMAMQEYQLRLRAEMEIVWKNRWQLYRSMAATKLLKKPLPAKLWSVQNFRSSLRF